MPIVSLATPKITLQLLLSLQGENPGPLDGLIGPKTTAALQAFQAARNLPACLPSVYFALDDPQTGPALRSFPSNPGAKAAMFGSTYLGLMESPPNSNKTLFGEWFGENGVAWCNIFLSFCFQMSGGIELCSGFKGSGVKPGKGCAYVPTTLAWLKAQNLLVATQDMLPGDIVIHAWDHKTPEHISLCCGKTDGNLFPSLEGNTSVSSDSNGGEVLLRPRSTTYVLAVGRMAGKL
jgi:hypothetical protein